MSAVDAIDRELVLALQEGLPLDPEPWAVVASRTGVDEAMVVARLRAMLASGAVRRIAAVPNHYRMGMTANGMSVWDIDDERVDRLGERIGALPFVSHCYRRPRRLPEWPYNLFAMLHGSTREEVHAKREKVASILGDACRGSDILFSRRILKKTGLRLAAEGSRSCSD